MSASPNLDLVRSLYEGRERGDFGSVEWAHPQIEWIIADGPTAGSWTGLAGMAESFRGMLGAWEDLRVEVDEYHDLDGERVLVLHHLSGRGKTSGLEIGQVPYKGATLLHVRDGKLTRLVHYWDRERAFADLGLTPEAGSR